MHREPARAHAVLPRTSVSVRGECSKHCEARPVTLGISSCSSSNDQCCNETQRLERCKRLLCQLTVMACKNMLFTDEKIFYLNPPVNNQNNTLWFASRKQCDPRSRLLIEQDKFVPCHGFSKS